MPVLGELNHYKGGYPTKGDLMTGITVQMCHRGWDR
jgi:hypothetical protein